MNINRLQKASNSMIIERMISRITKIKFQVFIICIAGFLIATIKVQAQNNTSSPFSIVGIGEIETRDFGRTTGMGNIGVGVNSTNFLNRTNPAGFSSIDTMSFIFDFSAAVKFSRFSTKSQKEHTTDFNFKNIAIGFRASKRWAVSVGISPYSNVGYYMVGNQLIEGTEATFQTAFSGNGGVNKFYWGNAVSLFRGFSLGVTASYLFGTINHIEDADVMVIQQESSLNKLYFDFGFQYTYTFNEHTRATLGGIYGYKTDIDLSRRVNITSKSGTTLKDASTANEKTNIPESYGIGFSILRHQKDQEWLFGVDYKYQKWSVNHSSQPGIKFTDSHIYSFGLQLTPNVKRPEKYLQIVRYQIGGCYNRSYLLINGHQLEDLSLSLGVGLPIYTRSRNHSYVNVALNLGQSATGRKGGINERYALLSVNFSLVEMWFTKRKLD